MRGSPSPACEGITRPPSLTIRMPSRTPQTLHMVRFSLLPTERRLPLLAPNSSHLKAEIRKKAQRAAKRALVSPIEHDQSSQPKSNPNQFSTKGDLNGALLARMKAYVLTPTQILSRLRRCVRILDQILVSKNQAQNFLHMNLWTT